MNKRILIADDDEAFHSMIQRALGSLPLEFLNAFNGEDTFRLAQGERPDLILLDVDMPKGDGRQIIKRLRANNQTQSIPVIMITAQVEPADKVAGLDSGADDYITKPFGFDELRARVQSIFRRNQRDISANPLTRLPGSPMIEEQVNHRIRENVPFAFFYIDIDHFKALNDAYGYAEGDRVIEETAILFSSVLKEFGRPDDFLGHIGGDDFVLITHPACAEKIALEISARFDAKAPSYYTLADRSRGYVQTHDRLGRDERFPLVSLSVAIATTEKRRLDHYAKVVEIASEIKRYLKNLKVRKGSVFLKDRWTDNFRPGA